MKFQNILAAFADKEEIVCAGEGKLYLLHHAAHKDFETVLAALLSAGYGVHDRRNLEKNDFAVLTGEEVVLTLSHIPHNETIRLAVQPGEKLPEKSEGERICAPLLTQMKLSYFTDDCGMTYILRLQDGRFVLIDGGVGKYDEGERLMDILRAQNVLPKIRIAAWFITHPHSDHFGGFTALMEEFSDQVELEQLLFNWPTQAFTGPSSPMERFDAVISSMRGRIATPHSGQRYHFSGLDIDVLFACDDLYPNPFPNINDSSMVLRMTWEGRSLLFPGDGQEKCSEELCARYGSDTLKCDFLQVPHHGYWGGSQELFERVDPQIVLWPCPDFWYQEIIHWECNRFFKQARNIDQIIVGGQQEVTLDMTCPIPVCIAYPPEKTVLMDEKFEHGSMTALNWSCVTGGSTGYRAVQVDFPETGGCCLTAGENRSVIELIQPGRLTGLQGLRVKMIGSTRKKPALFGLWWNHARPTVWAEDDILPLTVAEDGSINIDLTLDFAGRPDGGLYLLMQEGELVLTEVRIEKL